MAGKNFCEECGQPNLYHFNTWLEELGSHLLPPLKLAPKIESLFDVFLEKLFIFLKLAQLRPDFKSSDIQLRSSCFIDEMKKRGAVFYALQSIFGFTSHFKMEISGKIFRFETLPAADFESKYTSKIVDDKELAKRHCEKGGFPVARGRSFWFWQKNKAIQFGRKIGFPLVVKPRGGSVSRHVTTDIQSEEHLEKAIRRAIVYSPAFIVEKFITDGFVYRATVIDFDFTVCVTQVPANITGDGVSTIRKLIDEKNSRPDRGNSKE
ncbi:MAG: hypothetical protein HYV77_01630 [Candidatus Wildermuthbacteria bacterium]|nr:hypothetical protein [Candidatus Wildermuthbacteria bacterium]